MSQISQVKYLHYSDVLDRDTFINTVLGNILNRTMAEASVWYVYNGHLSVTLIRSILPLLNDGIVNMTSITSGTSSFCVCLLVLNSKHDQYHFRYIILLCLSAGP